MATFKAIVFSQANHIKNDGTTNIKIRIYHARQSQYISTDHYILPEYMCDNGEVSENMEGATDLNYEITDTIQGYRKMVMKLGSARLSKMTCKDLKDHIQQAMKPDYEFIDFVQFSESIIDQCKKTKTAEWYGQAVSVMKWFYKQESIDCREITSSKLNALMSQLSIAGQKKKPLQAGAIGNYLAGIRALFNLARIHYNNEDIDIIRIPHDPFEKVKIPKSKRKRKNIGTEGLKKIRDGVFVTERECIGRDVLMMQFYLMGININDLYKLQPPVGGRLIYERSKTDTDDNLYNFALSIKIEPELQVLLDKYSPDGFLSVIRDRYSCSYNFMKAVNKGLKKICDDLGLEKITSNWARHTWASLGRNKADIPKADVDFCLGHVNNDYKMADFYIEIDYSIFDKTNRKVLDLLVDKPEEKRPVNSIRRQVEENRSKNTHLRIVV